MKTIKFLAALAIMMGFGMSAMAQTSNDQISANATVLQQVVVDSVSALNFGWLSPGMSKTIDLQNVATGSQIGYGTENTGVFSVSASAGSNVQIQFTTLPTDLVNGGNNLPIGTWTAGYDLTTSFAGTTFVPATGIQVAGGTFPTNNVGGSNLIYVFIGGTVTAGGSLPAGDYTNNITLTAIYN